MTQANVPTSIKPLNLYKQVPMDDQISRILMSLMMQKGLGEQICGDLEEKQVFHYMVGKTRAEALGVKLDKDVMAMISVLSNGPGSIIMYLHAIYHRQLRNAEYGEERDVNLSDLCEMFAVGFPDEQTMTQAWDAQKGGRDMPGIDNMIDHTHLFKARYSSASL